MAIFQSSNPPEFYHLGLLGWPLAHSLSPRLHAAALHAVGLEGEYRLYPIAPGAAQENELAALLERVRKGELHGLNVTIPHKQAVIPLLDELTPVARAVGAVNTILRREGWLIGDNTDAEGFLADLSRCLPFSLTPNPSAVERGEAALVLGAGGSARAVTYALIQTGWWVYVAARRLEQAEELGKQLAVDSGQWAVGSGQSAVSSEQWTVGSEQLLVDNEHLSAIRHPPSAIRHPPSAIRYQPSAISEIAPTCRLIVNCTPLGMSPNVVASPWPEEVPFPPAVIVYDLVYNPPETAFVRAAREAGLQATTGLGMLIEQAALAFERWTGRAADREAMRKAVL